MKRIGQFRITVTKKHICILLGILFALTLIPLLILSFYAHPSGDDYSFGRLTYAAVANGGNLIDILKAACERVAIAYEGWQGTYSAIFLMALQPGIWGENFYFLTTFFLLFSLILSHIFFFRVICKHYFQADRSTYWIIALVVLTLCIQFPPSALQAFYWYNGGLYYTFFHSLMLVLFGIMVLALDRPSWKGKVGYGVLLSVLCFVIGGGNYVTALLTSVVYFLALGYLCLKKRFKQNWFLVIPFVILLGGFLVNILAPGNAVRQSLITEKPSALESVFLSFKYAVDYSNKWLTLPLVVALLFLTPFLFKMAQRSKSQFRTPLFVSFLSFCLFAAMFCPPLYAMNNVGDDRLVNILYYSYVLLFVGNLFYWIGWGIRKYENYCGKHDVSSRSLFESLTTFAQKRAIPGILCLGILFSVSVYSCSDLPPSSTASALYSLTSGEAQTFREEENQRIQLYHDPSVKEVYLTPFSVQPYLLYYSWMETVPLKNIANYYGKDLVAFADEE